MGKPSQKKIERKRKKKQEALKEKSLKTKPIVSVKKTLFALKNVASEENICDVLKMAKHDATPEEIAGKLGMNVEKVRSEIDNLLSLEKWVLDAILQAPRLLINEEFIEIIEKGRRNPASLTTVLEEMKRRVNHGVV